MIPGTPSGHDELVRVVPGGGQRSRLGVADLGVAFEPAAAVVVHLRVEVLLGEAEVVRPVVVPVVRGEQVGRRGHDVVGLR